MRIAILPVMLAGGMLLSAQEQETLPSGPKEGKLLPRAFDCYTLNGPKENQGRYHCLVCRYGLNPTVLVFAREQDEAKDVGLKALLKRLEDAVGKDDLHAGVIFLSPDAQSSVTNPKEDDPAKLVEEAKRRDELHARLSARAENFKGVDVAVMPADGPKDYGIDPRADVTVVVCAKQRVLMSRGYRGGALNDAAIDAIMAKAKEAVEFAKKKLS
jgi:hypothetical protein